MASVSGSTSSAPRESSTFESIACSLSERTRDVLARVLQQLPGAPVRPLDLSTALAIDMNLAWKVCQVVSAADPYAALQRLPGAEAMRIFRRAISRKMISKELLSELDAVLADHAQLIVVHAGTRKGLDLLLGNLADSGAIATDLASRRAASHAMSGLLGVRAKTQVVTYIFAPTEDGISQNVPPHKTQAVILRGMVAFQRMGPDISWTIGRGQRSNNDGSPHVAIPVQPLDPSMATRYGGVPLFHTDNAMPPVVRSISDDGLTIDRVTAGPVGMRGAMSFFLAERITSALPAQRDDRNSHLRLAATSHTPADSLVLDVCFHERLPPLGPMELRLLSGLGGPSISTASPSECIHMRLCESVEDRGKGLQCLRLEESAAYLPTLLRACESAGISERGLRSYRVRVPLAPVPCSIMIQRALLW